MTVEEVFIKLISHMIEGIKFHNEMVREYNFLGLYGFAKCHEYHMIEELYGYQCLEHYYSTHYHKLIQADNTPKPELIPESWYKYNTLEVDNNTRKQAIKMLMEKWIEWEKETKEFYQSMYTELCSLGEHSSANKLLCYINDVSEELKHAEKKLIKLQSIDYDLITITEWQQPMYKKFKKELKNIY